MSVSFKIIMILSPEAKDKYYVTAVFHFKLDPCYDEFVSIRMNVITFSLNSHPKTLRRKALLLFCIPYKLTIALANRLLPQELHLLYIGFFLM